ncbi:hypothetical protein ACIHCM_29385 [Streptomyces sp. NPDC052023]|uniref:hypothetical protein n=1 Tax=Streptomyces sp. NPDC052023 TaxID=3365681 RepID=UPI0037D42432
MAGTDPLDDTLWRGKLPLGSTKPFPLTPGTVGVGTVEEPGESGLSAGSRGMIWTCDNTKRAENDKQRLHRPATLFRLDGGKWVSMGDQPATAVRLLGQGERMVLTIPDCVGSSSAEDSVTYCHTGPLLREHDGKRTKIAEGVLSLSAPSTAS